MEHCGEPCFDFTIPFGTFYFTDQVWPDYFIEAGTIWLWSDIGHNHVCHNCLGSIIGIICFLDAKWNDLVAGTRLAFGYNLDAYALSWLLLIWASFDAGAEVQSGALGWMSLVQKIKPVFPDMPTQGLFKIIRQPIYVAFALTTWTVPIWTPDQLCLAIVLSAYCLLAPRLKERRFSQHYGARFADYKAKTPYAFPKLSVFWKGRSSR